MVAKMLARIRSAAREAACLLSLGVFLSAIMVSTLISLWAVSLLLSSRGTSLLGWVLATMQLWLCLLPLGPPPRWFQAFAAHATRCFNEYFEVSVITEAEAALQQGQPYLVALEPHSVLPFAMPGVFQSGNQLAPRALSRCHGLASSVCFQVPLVRHLWHWIGTRPVSKKQIISDLAAGQSVVLCPGGVQECLYMAPGREVAFLRKRTGFVRLALQQGVPLVPAFAFGQTDMYRWIKPGPPLVPVSWINAFSRAVGAVPLLVFGRWLTWCPLKSHVTVAIGKPLELPRVPEPSQEQVQHYLYLFISEMQQLFERHKAIAGQKDVELHIL